MRVNTIETDLMLQGAFFEKVKQGFNKDEKLVDVICETFHMTRSGAYKKISGASKLNLNEIIQLCRRVNISFDEFTGGISETKTSYPFYSDALKVQLSSYHEYWENICNHLQKLEGLSNLSGYYVTNELPLFYYVQFPSLFYFKNFVWNQTRWKIPNSSTIFSKEEFHQNSHLRRAAEDIVDVHTTYKSVEIWNPDMLRITYMQLKHYVRSGGFKNAADILNILEDIERLLLLLKNICISGFKMKFGSTSRNEEIKIYLNDLSINTEIIYIKSDEFKIVYNKFDAPNYLRTDDPNVCEQIESWVDEMIAQSTMISAVGERDRNYFFKSLFEEFDLMKSQVEGLIQSNY